MLLWFMKIHALYVYSSLTNHSWNVSQKAWGMGIYVEKKHRIQTYIFYQVTCNPEGATN